MFVPVAQLDRVFGYEPKGQGFESLQARQSMISSTELIIVLCLQESLKV